MYGLDWYFLKWKLWHTKKQIADPKTRNYIHEQFFYDAQTPTCT